MKFYWGCLSFILLEISVFAYGKCLENVFMFNVNTFWADFRTRKLTNCSFGIIGRSCCLHIILTDNITYKVCLVLVILVDISVFSIMEVTYNTCSDKFISVKHLDRELINN